MSVKGMFSVFYLDAEAYLFTDCFPLKCVLDLHAWHDGHYPQPGIE